MKLKDLLEGKRVSHPFLDVYYTSIEVAATLTCNTKRIVFYCYLPNKFNPIEIGVRYSGSWTVLKEITLRSPSFYRQTFYEIYNLSGMIKNEPTLKIYNKRIWERVFLPKLIVEEL